MRKVVREFINGNSISLGELGIINHEIERVYTIIDESLYQFNPLTGHKTSLEEEDTHLEHLGNVFLEDSYHDWRVSNGVFSFYGHSGSKGQKHDLLLILK
jgi:hypothetical protein